MGIAISELLTLEYFKDFRVLAGGDFLNREVQGITVLDAPDSFRWTRGKEMILSSGYVLAQNPDCVKAWSKEGFLTQMGCLVIKAGRYISQIPQELINLFDQAGIPLLEAPFSVAYMDLMHQVNVAIMNKTTKRFCIPGGSTAYRLKDDSYKERKLRRILQAVEADMKFPAFLYDLSDQAGYASSANFQNIAKAHALKASDFWSPDFPHTKHTICDSLGMVRYRISEEEKSNLPRFSWITVPISFGGSVHAYFVVVESRDLIDYYDEYAIRIATLLLQSVYEQIIIARNVGNIGFENLIRYAISCGIENSSQLISQADTLNFSVTDQYIFAVFEQTCPSLDLSEYREIISDELRLCCPGEAAHFALLQKDQCLVMLRFSPLKSGQSDIPQQLENIKLGLSRRLPQGDFKIGYFGQPGTLTDASKNIERCRQAVRLGRLFYPDKSINSYESFGPLSWLRLSEEELEMMSGDLLPLLSDPKNHEMLHTLKVYLASNMNFSDTAEKLYVHINTVRKRIERVNDLLQIDWNDTFSRMKLELLLQLMNI